MQQATKARRRDTVGVKLEDKNPHWGASCIRAYAETRNKHKAAVIVGVAPNTVVAVVHRNPDEFARVNNELAIKHQTVAGMCLDRLMTPEKLDQCSGQQLSVMSRIHSQRSLELQGVMPTGGLNIEDLRKAVKFHDALTGEMHRRGVTQTEINVTPQEEAAKPPAEAKRAPSENQAGDGQKVAGTVS